MPGTAIVMARDAPSHYVLLERGGPPVLLNSRDVQAVRFRTSCWALCLAESLSLYFFEGDFVDRWLTRKEGAATSLSSESKEREMGVGRKQTVATGV